MDSVVLKVFSNLNDSVILFHRNCKIYQMPAYNIKAIQILGIDFFFSSFYFNLMSLITMWINCQDKLDLHRKHHLALIF